jgi:hypothetical protein
MPSCGKAALHVRGTRMKEDETCVMNVVDLIIMRIHLIMVLRQYERHLGLGKFACLLVPPFFFFFQTTTSPTISYACLT